MTASCHASEILNTFKIQRSRLGQMGHKDCDLTVRCRIPECLRVAACCSVLQRVAACCSASHCVIFSVGCQNVHLQQSVAVCCRVSQCVAVSVRCQNVCVQQLVAANCGMLQCVAVRVKCLNFLHDFTSYEVQGGENA